MTLEYLGCGYRHGGIEKDGKRRGQSVLLDPLAQEKYELLRPLEREGRNEDVPAACQCRVDGIVQLRDRGAELLVRTVAIRGLHHDRFGGGRRLGGAQQQPPRIPDIAGKEDAAAALALVELDEHARRSEDMSSVEEGGTHARSNLDRLSILGGAAELAYAIHRIDDRIERRLRLAAAAAL